VQHRMHSARAGATWSDAGDHGSMRNLLIYDEVITGFRLNMPGPGALRYSPDLSYFARVWAGVSGRSLGGRKDIMDLVADGTVSMAGTYAANTIAVAAAHAALTS